MAKKQGIVLAVGLAAWTALAVFAAQYLMQFLFWFLMSTFHFSGGTVVQTIYSALVYVTTIVILLGVPVLLRKKLKLNVREFLARDSLGLTGLPTWTDILLSPIGFVAQLFLSTILVSAFTIFPWFNVEEVQETGYSDLVTAPDRLIAFLAIAVIAPVAEEVIFRGFLYGKLREKLDFGKKYDWLNLPVSIFVTSLVFTLMHGQWNVGVNVFAVSVVLCLMRELTGTIYSGILVHILKNAVAFWLLFIR